MKVTERALFGRVDRALRHEGEKLHRCRYTSRDFYNVGRYFITSRRSGLVLYHDIGLEAVGRELGVLRECDELVEE